MEGGGNDYLLGLPGLGVIRVSISSFIHSVIPSIIQSFFLSFIQSFILSFIRYFYSFIHSSIHSFNLLFHSFILDLISVRAALT